MASTAHARAATLVWPLLLALAGGSSAAPCPETAYFESRDAGAELDLGWTGTAHGIEFTGWSFGLKLGACEGTTRGACGRCQATAVSRAADEQHQRCLDRPWQTCTQDSECAAVGAAGPCVLFTGPPAALATGGSGLCAVGTVSGAVTGSVDVEAGSLTAALPLTVRLYTGSPAVPCPRCILDGAARDGARGGRCDQGLRAGEPCDAQAAKRGRTVGATSLDCPPDPDALIGTLTTAQRSLTLTTGSRAEALDAASPVCRAPVFGDKGCLCDVCADDPAQPCQRDADCATGVCGAAAGAASAPNGCADGVCTPVGPTDGICNAGPFEGRCGPREGFRHCTDDVDCPVEGDTCTRAPRSCFPGNGVHGSVVSAKGTIDERVGDTKEPILTALFCVPPTTNGAVNEIAGLPGPGRLRLPGRLSFGAAQ